jgi:hypothetical protein
MVEALTEDTRMNFPEAGFAIDIPSGWTVQTAEAVRAHQGRVAEGLEDANIPLLTATRYSAMPERVNPTVSVVYGALPKGAPAEPSKLLEALIVPMANMFEDFQYLEPPKDSKPFGHEGAWCAAAYTLNHGAEEKALPVSSSVWLVVQGEAMLLISVAVPPQPDPDWGDGIEHMLGSIEIAHANA